MTETQAWRITNAVAEVGKLAADRVNPATLMNAKTVLKDELMKAFGDKKEKA